MARSSSDEIDDPEELSEKLMAAQIANLEASTQLLKVQAGLEWQKLILKWVLVPTFAWVVVNIDRVANFWRSL